MPEGYRHLTHPGRYQIHATGKSGISGPSQQRYEKSHRIRLRMNAVGVLFPELLDPLRREIPLSALKTTESRPGVPCH